MSTDTNTPERAALVAAERKTYAAFEVREREAFEAARRESRALALWSRDRRKLVAYDAAQRSADA